ncbi:MAG: hypothetical protein JKY92_05495 [Magnetovibrio sp.]|nr:hypothetical protein [Magnetovibrio sp.]
MDNLVELCLAKTNGTLGSSEVVQRIDQAINEILDSRRKVSSVQLRFIKHIIESLNNINLISPITFLILHDKLLAKNSGKTNSETLFLEYAGILFALRGILYDWETKATKELKKFDNDTYKCLNGTLYLPHHHDLTSATVLANNIFLIAGINLDEVELNVQKGSAYIKFVFKSVVSLASLLTAMNMVLAEVDIGVKNINSIKEGMENLTQSSRQQSPSDIIKRPSQQDRMMQIVTSNKNSALLEKASEITQEQGDTFLDFEGREARLVIEI